MRISIDIILWSLANIYSKFIVNDLVEKVKLPQRTHPMTLKEILAHSPGVNIINAV
jgi:hypothetical protein